MLKLTHFPCKNLEFKNLRYIFASIGVFHPNLINVYMYGTSNNSIVKMRKLTTADFIRKAIAIHGNKYDYSKVEYVNPQSKVCITCPKHGEFEQTPINHLFGKGCPKCSKEKMNSRKTLTKEWFVGKAIEVHGDKYDYSKVEYKNNRTKVSIICPEHGEFCQVPSSHLSGHGCPKCANNIQHTTE